MSGLLQHSPADITRHQLIAMGKGNLPPTTPWPIYVTQEPSDPDDVITLQDTTGRDHGSSHIDGERFEHHGVQIRIRSSTHVSGWLKSNDIAMGIDKDTLRQLVVIGGRTYWIQKISRVGDVIALGKDSPSSQRHLFTINVLIAVHDITI